MTIISLILEAVLNLAVGCACKHNCTNPVDSLLHLLLTVMVGTEKFSQEELVHLVRCRLRRGEAGSP